MPWLTLLLSPVGRYALMAGTICLAFAAGYVKGHVAADRSAEIAQLRASEREAVRQAHAAHQIATDAAERARRVEAIAASLQSEIDAYEEELTKRPDTRCALGPADLKRLRRLAAPGPSDPASGSIRFR